MGVAREAVKVRRAWEAFTYDSVTRQPGSESKCLCGVVTSIPSEASAKHVHLKSGRKPTASI